MLHRRAEAEPAQAIQRSFVERLGGFSFEEHIAFLKKIEVAKVEAAERGKVAVLDVAKFEWIYVDTPRSEEMKQ